jgi:hypothetical protein
VGEILILVRKHSSLADQNVRVVSHSMRFANEYSTLVYEYQALSSKNQTLDDKPFTLAAEYQRRINAV